MSGLNAMKVFEEMRKPKPNIERAMKARGYHSRVGGMYPLMFFRVHEGQQLADAILQNKPEHQLTNTQIADILKVAETDEDCWLMVNHLTRTGQLREPQALKVEEALSRKDEEIATLRRQMQALAAMVESQVENQAEARRDQPSPPPPARPRGRPRLPRDENGNIIREPAK